MEVLTALRQILLTNTNTAGAASGGIFLVQVGQNAARPNLMLMLVSGDDDWTHQGPDGLFQQIVRIYSRGDTVQEASELASAVREVLNGYVSASSTYGVSIKLAQRTNSTGDYQDGAEVYRQIDDYRVTYRLD